MFEIQIENLMPSPFVLEVFKFEPAENCTVVSCSDSYPGDEFVLFVNVVISKCLQFV